MKITKEWIRKWGLISVIAAGNYFAGSLTYHLAYKRGYEEGYQQAQQEWRLALIDADFAEYDRRTGNWKFRSMEEVLMVGTIMGQMPISGIFPEPPVDKEDVKFALRKASLKSKIR